MKMNHFEIPQLKTCRHAIRFWTGIFLACLTGFVCAQSPWPDKPVRIIVPTAAGSGSDLIARTLAQRLSEIWKQSVVVENKAGASGIIGVDAVVKAAPDGFTLLMSSASPLVINPVIFRKLPHDPLKQLAPVSHVGIAPAAFLVNSTTAVTNLKELVALAKAQPKKLSYGSFGQGSGAHLAIEAFNQSAGIDMIHVPYKGTGPAVSDLIAGQITLTLADLATAQSQIKAGKLRAIAINGPARSPLLPDVATFTEQAYPAMEGTYARFGLLAPVGTPQAILNKVSADTITALNDPMVSDRFTSLGYTLTGSTPEKLRNWLKEDAERWGKVIQAIGGIVLD
jgi:tripartite-type tricarboxylate transporter receptor subunit TctC